MARDSRRVEPTIFAVDRQRLLRAVGLAAGAASCRFRITRPNPTDAPQDFLGAIRIEGEVE